MLPYDHDGLERQLSGRDSASTRTDSPGENESRPVNNVDWFLAFAFCAWDGGRLPTEAEWEYATAGGDENRPYPWGDAKPAPSLAVYDCTGDGSASGDCDPTGVLPVGSRPAGNGRWGHADLAGNILEWTLDHYEPLGYGDVAPGGCNDCADLTPSPGNPRRTRRGGSWNSPTQCLLATCRFGEWPDQTRSESGIRCARDAP